MWIITKDYLVDEESGIKSRVGTCSSKYDAEKFATRPQLHIRLLDDDGEVYYEGLATKKRILDSGEDLAFAPLDWAMADAGCTEMQYRENENQPWETL